jgi:iron-sulfur cluster assembly accessory protein
MLTPVQLTKSAETEVLRLLQTDASAIEKGFLRVGVKGGGCSGMTYVLEFDEPKPADKHFLWGSIPMIIDPSHELYLMGMEVDWQGGLNARGFTFNNPNASSTCGCGTSFAV